MDLRDADLTGAAVFGVSAWDVNDENAIQKDFALTPASVPTITLDNIKLAHFVYLLLNNRNVRDAIDTITSKVVLILGRFTPKRKTILDAIREELRNRNYAPVLFDFEKPANKDLTGTVSALANIARFVIADLTDPGSVPHELAMLAPGTPVPIKPILLHGQQEYVMLSDLTRRYHWVLEPYLYKSIEQLIAHLNQGVIAPAEAKAKELTQE